MTRRISRLKNKVERDFKGQEIGFFWTNLIDHLRFEPINPFGCALVLNMNRNLIEYVIYSENTNQESYLMPQFVIEQTDNFFAMRKNGLKLAGNEYDSDELIYNRVVYLYTNQLLIDKNLLKEHFLKYALRLKICEYPLVSEEKRLAIICGNSDYEFQNKLKNTINDVRLIESPLNLLGFDIEHILNSTKTEFETRLRDISQKINQYNEIFFYYAGHGFYTNGSHYLAPIESEVKSTCDLEENTIRFDFIDECLNSLSNPIRVFVLDSCRIPVASDFSPTPMERISTPNTIVIFSTSPGSGAKDGHLANSPFTLALTKYLTLSDTSIEQVFKKVIDEVKEQTNSAQLPWILSSLQSDYMLNEKINAL